jgi:hypothetical protein
LPGRPTVCLTAPLELLRRGALTLLEPEREPPPIERLPDLARPLRTLPERPLFETLGALETLLPLEPPGVREVLGALETLADL